MINILKTRKKVPPRLPEGMRIYAIGDVHGRADLLDRLLSRVDAHAARNAAVRPVYLFIGDYVDRGPASCEVLDLLIDCARGREMVFLKGNHETFVDEFLKIPATFRDWARMGGIETLMSYGLRPSINADATTQRELAAAFEVALPRRHLEFLGSLRPSFSCGGFFFVHAGVRPGIPLTKQREEDLLWIRDDFLLHEGDFGKIVVHGHTPVREIDIRPNRIDIDTGAYATGRLSCLIIEDDRFEPL